MVPGGSSYSMKFFNLCIDLIYLLYIPLIIHGHEINLATLGSMSLTYLVALLWGMLASHILI